MESTFPYIEIVLASTFIFLFLHWSRNRNSPIIDWPIVGMLPGLIFNLPNFNDFVTKILKQSGGTFELKGPWFTNLRFVLTSDPANIHHILSKNFANYPKGPEFREMFTPLGQGILTVDSGSWKFQRKMMHTYFSHAKFQPFLERTICGQVAKSLIPVLDHVCDQEMEVDLQDVFGRLYFDNSCLVSLGFDPKSLSIDFPEAKYEKAWDDMEEAVMYRHVVPESYWKLQRWLRIGHEKKLIIAQKIFDHFIYKCIESKQDTIVRTRADRHEASFDFLTAYLTEEAMKEGDTAGVTDSGTFLRDAATNMVVAGKDAMSAAVTWFFWLVATNPEAETKILEEIEETFGSRTDIFSAGEVEKLVYLHAAMCETLRLYPPVPTNHKASVQPDTLPSGHRVDANTKMFISFYAVARMEGVWGRDCSEFRPERWVSGSGGIRRVPSYKFTAFNAGPRTCLGKNMAMMQMKMIAVAILAKYKVRVVEDHIVVPTVSVIFNMKHGLKVRVTKRS